MSPRVQAATSEDLQLQRLRTQTPKASRPEALHAPRRLHVGLGVDGLVEVEMSVHSPAERMDQVVGVLHAESAQQDPALIRRLISVGVAQMQDLR